MKLIGQSISKRTLIVVALLICLFFNFFRGWKVSHPFTYDSDQYYCYLVGLGIHGDLEFKFPNSYWLHEGPIGKPVQKMSVGVAIMEAPFFLIGHWIAKIFDFKADGYSPPYAYCISFGVILYVLMGLNWLRKSLLHFFSEFATTLTLLGVFLGTNLFYYTVSFGTMSHPFLFMLLSGLIYSTIRWHQTFKVKYLYTGLFIAGLATVIRPTQLLMLFVPVFYGVHNWSSFQEKWKLIIGLKWKLAIAVLLFMIPIFPQLLYWKTYAGSWLYFSYHKEGFFFADPKIWESLFSFRKGWFIYTPIMIFAFVGLIFYRSKQFSLAFKLYFLVGFYVMSSWWCWWYGGSYGMRSMIDFYPMFAFPLAFIIQKYEGFKKGKIATVLVLFLLIANSIVGTIQYKRILIHWDAMTMDSFFSTKFKVSLSSEERREWEKLLCVPDYEGALEGKRGISDCFYENKQEVLDVVSQPEITVVDKSLFFVNDLNECGNCTKKGFSQLTPENPYAGGFDIVVDSANFNFKKGDQLILEGKLFKSKSACKFAFVYEVSRNKKKVEYQSIVLQPEDLEVDKWEIKSCAINLNSQVQLGDRIKGYLYMVEGHSGMVDYFKIFQRN